MEYISEENKHPDIIVFLDGDYSDYPSELTKIVAPIVEDNIDFVVGARVKASAGKWAHDLSTTFRE